MVLVLRPLSWVNNMAGNPYDQFDGPSDSANLYDQFDSAKPPVSVSPPAPGQSWGDAIEQTPGNIIPSATSALENIGSAFAHPINTAKGLVGAATAGLRGEYNRNDPSHPVPIAPEDQQKLDAMKDHFINHYGSEDAFKHAVATDPVGVLMDASVILGPAAEGIEGAGVLGDVGSAIGATGRALNPVNAVAKGVSGAGKVMSKIPGAAKVGNAILNAPGNAAASLLGGITTGAGANSIRGAYQAGVAGGDAGKAFTDSMRGNTPWSQVVTDAKTALGNMRASRNAAYRSGMADISKDATILDFKPIDDALENANSINSYKGQDLSPNTTAVREDINSAVNNWKLLDPAEYHTPEGFDALKQKIGDIKDAQPFGSSQRTIASNAYNAVRKTIADQAPAYSDVMSDYSKASDQLDAMQKELSLGPKGNPNTALRKLQSVMRDNANTSWGQRADYANTLAENGAPNLMPSLAGQALSTVIPRGLAKYADLGMMGAAGLAHLPVGVATALASSPRLMGEAAYGLGAAGRKLAPLGRGVTRAAPGASQIGYEADVPQLTDQQQPAPLSDSTATLMHIAAPQGYAEGGRIHDELGKDADTEPTDAQIGAGNYKKAHVSLHGFNISIETPKGAARRGFGADGKMWENRHETSHYGYLKRTEGADSENIDCYIGPHHASKRIFVVNQIDPKTKKFDEHKIIFGARTPSEARKIYDGGFSDGSGPKRRWAVHETNPVSLKAWLSGKRTAKPFPSELAAAA